MSHRQPTIFLIYNDLRDDMDLRKTAWAVRQIISFFPLTLCTSIVF